MVVAPLAVVETEMVPQPEVQTVPFCVMLQFTPLLFGSFETAALNCWAAPAASDTDFGETETVMPLVPVPLELPLLPLLPVLLPPHPTVKPRAKNSEPASNLPVVPRASASRRRLAARLPFRIESRDPKTIKSPPTPSESGWATDTPPPFPAEDRSKMTGWHRQP